MTLHDLLDWHDGAGGEGDLRRMLAEGADPNARAGPLRETALHVAVRRRRREAAAILPGRPDDGAYLRRLLEDASPGVETLLREASA